MSGLSWQKWALLAWFAAAAILSILSTGKQRKPSTPEVVAISLVVLGLLCALVVTA